MLQGDLVLSATQTGNEKYDLKINFMTDVGSCLRIIPQACVFLYLAVGYDLKLISCDSFKD